MGEYVPSAPSNDDARKRNGNLPGQGGVFNYVNPHVYQYAGNNPVKYVDPDGEWVNFAIGAGIGFVSSATTEVGGRMVAGQSFGTAIKNTFTDGKSLAIIGASTGIGALTSGMSGIAVNVATKGATSVAKVAATTIAINTASGAVDAAAKDVTTKAITGQSQNLKETAIAAGEGAISAAVFSTVTQGAIAYGSTTATATFSNNNGSNSGTRIIQPEWAGSAGVVGESIIPAFSDTIKTLYNQQVEQ
jgi:hypothetical protein